MAYLLLSRDADGLLRLLSESSFPSRQEALVELSTITGTPEFHSWSSEVFLVDLDAATPVLLVRPAASLPMSEIEISALEPSAVAVAAGEPAPLDYAQADYARADAGLAEAPDDEESAGASSAAAFLADVGTTPVGDAAIADAIVESASEPTPPASIGYGRPAREASGDELRAALRRSAAQMQDEGVAVPEAAAAPVGEAPSTAPADQSTPLPAEKPAARPVWPMVFGAAPAAPPTATAAPPAPATEPVGELEPAPVSAEAAQEPATVWQPEASPEPLPGEEAVAAESEPAPEPEAAPDFESETIPDQTGVSSASFAGDAAGEQRSVPTPWPWDVVAPEAAEPESAAAPAEESAEELPTVPAGSQPAEVEGSTPPSVTEGTSDFILDLDQPASGEPVLVVEPAAPLPEVETPLSTALDAYVCDDCAYAETCPNKDQRLPKECGSFQWR